MANTVTFLKKIRNQDAAEYLKALFLYNAAPVIKMLKPAVLMNIPFNANVTETVSGAAKTAVISEMGLRVKTLAQDRLGERVLVYSSNLLVETLKNWQSAGILHSLGYGGSVENLLNRLSERFEQEKCPHEIGLFLGYPPKDVEGFIENKGANYILCGNWKVYANPEYARKKWREWRLAKEKTAKLLINGVSCRAAIKLI
jgi:hypothetical protein